MTTPAIVDVRCRRCSRAHRFGQHAVGDRVAVRATTPRADGIQAGARGVVVVYRILSGAQHQRGGRSSMVRNEKHPSMWAHVVMTSWRSSKSTWYVRNDDGTFTLSHF